MSRQLLLKIMNIKMGNSGSYSTYSIDPNMFPIIYKEHKEYFDTMEIKGNFGVESNK